MPVETESAPISTKLLPKNFRRMVKRTQTALELRYATQVSRRDVSAEYIYRAGSCFKACGSKKSTVFGNITNTNGRISNRSIYSNSSHYLEKGDTFTLAKTSILQ